MSLPDPTPRKLTADEEARIREVLDRSHPLVYPPRKARQVDDDVVQFPAPKKVRQPWEPRRAA